MLQNEKKCVILQLENRTKTLQIWQTHLMKS